MPYGSSIFKACDNEVGGVDGAIAAMKQSYGSIHDTDPDGRTLLHYAAQRANAELCKWLIKQGIDSSAVDRSLMTPLSLLEYHWKPKVEDEDKVYDTARVLVEHGWIDPMSVDYRGESIPHYFIGNLKTFKYLMQLQEQFMIDLSQTDLLGRNPLQAKATNLAENVPILLRYLLDNNQTPLETARKTWLESYGPMSLLLGAIRRLSEHYSYLAPIDTELNFLSELVLAGSDLHIQDGFGATPLDHLLNTNWDRPYSEVNKKNLLHSWVSCLCSCGIDLQQYFRKEQELHPGGKFVPVDAHRRNIDRVLTVYYGTSSDDVTILVEDGFRAIDAVFDLPGSWDIEAEYAESHNLRLIDGGIPSALWSVTTAGFQNGDFSPESSSCGRSDQCEL